MPKVYIYKGVQISESEYLALTQKPEDKLKAKTAEQLSQTKKLRVEIDQQSLDEAIGKMRADFAAAFHK